MNRQQSIWKYLLIGFVAASGVASCVHDIDIAKSPSGRTFSDAGDFILAPTDQIKITVLEQASINGLYTIPSSGILSLPLIQNVAVAGNTVNQVRKSIETKLASYVKDPDVLVSVEAINSFKVYFLGEIGKPGVYAFDKRTTLLQGIAVAGGLTKFSSGKIVLLRAGSATGKAGRYVVNYERLLRNNATLNQFEVERGDVFHFE